ncbi:MAG: Na+/H+ antiporter NhaA, partial [Spirochaetota bacterium]
MICKIKMSAKTKEKKSFFIQFMTAESLGGLILIIVSIAALCLANSSSANFYFSLIHTKMSLAVGNISVSTNLLHFVNDALMAVFFLVVGLEIKREILMGELSSKKKALLPVAGAFGGMIVPIIFYAVSNIGNESFRGWGIPMATDIGFSLGILYLLGRRVPFSLKIFLSALAIVDDLGAVIIIAFFYSSGISWLNLGAAALVLAILWGLNVKGVRHIPVYIGGGIVLWSFMMASGIHSSLAGVALAAVIPSSFEEDQCGEKWSPSQRIESALHPVILYCIMPIFAFCNAGVAFPERGTAFFNPATIGIIMGLFVGKPLGIITFSFAAVKAGLCEWPHDAGILQFAGVAVLCGIGFTMSLFIAGLSFPESEILNHAKIGILAGSLLSAVTGGTIIMMQRGTVSD